MICPAWNVASCVDMEISDGINDFALRVVRPQCIGRRWRFSWRRWRLQRFVRERNWRNPRDWLRGRLRRWLGDLGLGHDLSRIPLIPGITGMKEGLVSNGKPASVQAMRPPAKL